MRFIPICNPIKINMVYFTYVQLIILCTIATLKPSIALNLSIVPFDEAFAPLYGNQSVVHSNDGKLIQISMDQRSPYGSGFTSQYAYNHGMFTALIKLPNNSSSAGVVASFYLQSKELMQDEIDFEFLGHVDGEKWVLQTNVYGNGSNQQHRGREERYTLPFDPSQDFHNYTILWNTGRIIFYVDEWPIREVENVNGMGGDFPSKPMSLYGTIWDGSDWATYKGKYRVDIQRGPFVTGYSFVINGCRVDKSVSMPDECDVAIPIGLMTSNERLRMKWVRGWCMTYSYCNDKDRSRDSFPECGVEDPGIQLAPAPQPVSSGASSRFM
ncbi:putative xyloglucan:xyloglucosyl transferase [Helianthus debilis subsp. tardiflorus]